MGKMKILSWVLRKIKKLQLPSQAWPGLCCVEKIEKSYLVMFNLINVPRWESKVEGGVFKCILSYAVQQYNFNLRSTKVTHFGFKYSIFKGIISTYTTWETLPLRAYDAFNFWLSKIFSWVFLCNSSHISHWSCSWHWFGIRLIFN